MNDFPSRLRQARGKRNQAEFADVLGVKSAAYGHYETGRSEPSLGVLLKIVENTGFSADWLLGVSNEKGSNPRAEKAEEKLHAVKKSLIALVRDL